MKQIPKLIVLSSLVSIMAACGGGDEDIGNNVALNVSPSGVNYQCPGAPNPPQITDFTVHTINGGFGPFRIRSSYANIIVGLADSNNQFVPAPSSMINSVGDLVLDGQDPKFAIAAVSLGCDSTDLPILVLDSRSTLVSVLITVAAPE